MIYGDSFTPNSGPYFIIEYLNISSTYVCRRGDRQARQVLGGKSKSSCTFVLYFNHSMLAYD